MTGRTYPAAVTGRRTFGGEGPVVHASTGMPRTRTGMTARALCGAGVYGTGAVFDPDHPRACPRCARSVRSRS